MEHFSVVQSIIRAGLAGDRAAFDKQVLRLRERLQKDGQAKEVETIDRLRASINETQEMARVESRSPAF